MRRILCCLMVGIMFFTGCQKPTYNYKDNTEVVAEQESTLKSAQIDPNKGIGTYIELRNVRVDEKTGEEKYSSYLDESISYDGSEIELGISMMIDPNSLDETVDAMAMMVIDEQLVPFSLDGSEEKILHNIRLGNSEITQKVICFSADNLEKDQESQWGFILVPLLDEYRHVLDETLVACCNRKIVSTVDKTSVNEKKYCGTDYFYDTPLNVYGKEMFDICEYNGAVRDYILLGADNKWYYMSDEHVGGNIVVFLFCDGELYNGFNGEYSLIIDKTEDNKTVNKEIDISGLKAGNHKMYAVVLLYNENGELYNARKSLVGEINVE